MESFFQKTYTISAVFADRYGRVKPSALLLFAQGAAEGHCDLLKLDWTTLAEKNLFWAIIRNRMQITRLPTFGETITVETWPMPTTRTAFPRATVAYDENGNEIFRSVSLWVLVDMQSRTMVLPGKTNIAVNGVLRGNELPVPGSILPKQLENSVMRRVGFTELDHNGHMNNTRYLDWISDLLPSEFHADHPIREFTIAYQNEATEGQLIQLNWQTLDGNCLQVDGRREKSDVCDDYERIFTAQILF